MKNILTLVFFLFFVSISWASLLVGGEIPIIPKYYMADTTTPFAIYFTGSTTIVGSPTLGFTMARLSRPGTGSFINQYCWSSSGTPGWRTDGMGQTVWQRLPFSNNTISGWLVVRSTTFAAYGTSSVMVRFRTAGTGNTDFHIAPKSAPTTILYIPITGLNPTPVTGNGGWITGQYMAYSNIVILVKDELDNILGTYISEDNRINEGYSSIAGYFKIALPIGTYNLKLTYLNYDTTRHGADYPLGLVTINAGQETNIGTVAIELSEFRVE